LEIQPIVRARTAHKDFYRRLDSILTGINQANGRQSMLIEILERVCQDLGSDVGINSGRLYRKDGHEFEIVRSIGAKGEQLVGRRIPASYHIFSALLADEVLYFGPEDEGVDLAIEESLGVGHFACFYVGADHLYVVSFGFDAEANPEDVLLTLNTLRHAINHRLREMALEGQLREAREIQTSSLPAMAPEFKGYELAGLSQPAEVVGGDILDFLPVDEHLIGLAIGDASGHGLPAALQARDVITGLRMGVERDMKITAVMRRLNRVIHRAGLTSRFVSVFYGELESNGNFVYVNAGHEPGILLRADGHVDQLGPTGIVMGPVENPVYRRDLTRLHPGDLLVLYTDGLCERHGSQGEFGRDALVQLIKDLDADSTPLAAIPQRVLEHVRLFGDGMPWADDVSVLAVRRRN